MTTASLGRFSTLLRWLGLTLVLLLGLQILALLAVNGWSEESFTQMLVERLVNQSPMALVGLLLMLFGSRLDHPEARQTPLRWVVCGLSALLAICLLLSIPVTISSDRTLTAQADQELTTKQGQIAMARSQSKNPQVIDQVIQQGERAGQIPLEAPAEQKKQVATRFIETQLKQAENQVKQAERARDLAKNQRTIGGTGTNLVLAIAFTLLALASVL
ncbi:MAG: HpsJ family protein [Cyanobacteria bacterium]|nr:HpsJ family protein [Cyanobacteriota bacterium]